jgi:hypothetical protein
MGIKNSRSGNYGRRVVDAKESLGSYEVYRCKIRHFDQILVGRLYLKSKLLSLRLVRSLKFQSRYEEFLENADVLCGIRLEDTIV